MRPSIPVVLWLLTLAASSRGAAQIDVPTIERLVARYDSAWNRRDSLTVNRLLAPKYQYFSSRGSVSSRVETMKFLSDPSYKLERAQRSETAVTLSGDVAVVSSRWRGAGTYQGERFVDDQRCGQTWVQTGKSWQLLNEHCVQIAASADSSSS
jgi:ketosteroid isomerase-like protein